MVQIVTKAGKVNSTSCHSCAESLWWGKVLAPSHTPNKFQHVTKIVSENNKICKQKLRNFC